MGHRNDYGRGSIWNARDGLIPIGPRARRSHTGVVQLLRLWF